MVDEKHWYQSKTIWGALLAIIASVMGAFGISLDAMAQSNIVDAIIQIIGGFGAIMAIYGRLSATDIIS